MTGPGADPAPLPWEDPPRRVGGGGLALRTEPDHPSRSAAAIQQHLQLGVVTFRGGFAGVFPGGRHRQDMNLHAGRSRDGVSWDIDPEPIRFLAADGRVREIQATFTHAYDPRVTWLEDRWYVTWCNGYHGPTIGIAWTHDFETFHQLDNAFLPFNRNGVLFPRRVGDRYLLLSRPSDGGHTAFGDIFLSESPDLVHWGRHGS